MKVVLQNLPKLHLDRLLKRRKMQLSQFVAEFGITTYGELLERCRRMGVVAPDEHVFMRSISTLRVNDPQGGVIVIEPLPVIAEKNGQKIDVDDDRHVKNALQFIEPTEPRAKRSKKKREEGGGLEEKDAPEGSSTD